ncbi:MAG: geranylgeranylglycerol-phosphate geranylgeranyltransferase [Bernardetiaceae bacterium]|nr:geranylgeranylglycerol-phosphate geranylgeranyltransferase [Bernardetiaceae bacterium]
MFDAILQKAKLRLRLFRLPNLLIIAITQYLIVHFLLLDNFWHANYLLFVLSTLLIAAAGYAINDYFDSAIDSHNKPHRAWQPFKVSSYELLSYYCLFNFLAWLIAFVLNSHILTLCLLTSFSLFIYSYRLKKWFFIGNIIIALLNATAVASLGLVAQNYPLELWAFASFAAWLTLLREIIKDMEDKEGDAIYGSKSMAVVWKAYWVKNMLYFIKVLFALQLFYFAWVWKSLYFFSFSAFFTGLLLFLALRIRKAQFTKDYSSLSLWYKILILIGFIGLIANHYG